MNPNAVTHLTACITVAGITALLADEEWTKRSDRWIAEKCGVDHKTVSKLRPSTGEVPQLNEPRTGKDGKERRQPGGGESAGDGAPMPTTLAPFKRPLLTALAAELDDLRQRLGGAAAGLRWCIIADDLHGRAWATCGLRAGIAVIEVDQALAELPSIWWPAAAPFLKRLVAHEAAHALAGQLGRGRRRWRSHGRLWLAAYRRCCKSMNLPPPARDPAVARFDPQPDPWLKRLIPPASSAPAPSHPRAEKVPEIEDMPRLTRLTRVREPASVTAVRAAAWARRYLAVAAGFAA